MSKIKNLLNYILNPEKREILKGKRNDLKLKDIPESLLEDSDIIKYILTKDINEAKYFSYNTINKKLIIELIPNLNNALIYRTLNNDFKNDEDIIRAVFKNQLTNSQGVGKKIGFEELPEKVKNNKKIVIDLIKGLENININKYDWKNDKEIIKEYLKYNLQKYNELSPTLKNDKEIIEIAINDIENYRYIDMRYKDDYELLVKYLKRGAFTFGDLKTYVPEHMQKSKEFAKLIAIHKPVYFDYLPQEFKNNKEIALVLASNNALYIDSLSEKLREEQEIIDAALKAHSESVRYLPKILSDDEKMRLFVEKNPKTYKYASKNLRNEKKLALKAIGIRSNMIEYIGDELKDDLDIFSKVLEENELAIKYAKENGNVRNNKAIAIKILKKKNMVYQYLSDSLREDEELIILALKNENEDQKEVLNYIPNFSRKSNEIKEIALKRDAAYFEKLSSKDKSNPDYALVAISSHAAYWNSIGQDLQEDKNFMLKSIFVNSDVLNYFTDKSWKNDGEFLLSIEKQLTEQKNSFPKEYELMQRFIRERELNQILTLPENNVNNSASINRREGRKKI